MTNMNAPVGDALRPEGSRDPYGVARARERLHIAYDWLEQQSGEGPWASASLHAGRLRCRAVLFYADWVEEIGDARPRSRPTASDCSRIPLSRAASRSAGISSLFPARSARPRLGESCRLPSS